VSHARDNSLVSGIIFAMATVASIDLDSLSRQRQGFIDRLGEALGPWLQPTGEEEAVQAGKVQPQEAGRGLVRSLADAIVPDPKDPMTWIPGPTEMGAPIVGQVWPEAKAALWGGWQASRARMAELEKRLLAREGVALNSPEAKKTLEAIARPLGVLREGLDIVDSRLPQYHGLTSPVTVQGEWYIPRDMGSRSFESSGIYHPGTDVVKIFGEPVSRSEAPGRLVNVLGHELGHGQQTAGRTLAPALDEYWSGRGQWAKRQGLRNFFINSPEFGPVIRQHGGEYLDYLSDPAEVIARGVGNEITRRAFPAKATPGEIYGPNAPLPYLTRSWPKKYDSLWRELADALAQ